MQDKYLKDLVIGLVVVMLIIFTVNDYRLFHIAGKVPNQSKYTTIALDEQLLVQIQGIEHSINDRKNFSFTVTKDPLLQDLIVKTKMDMQKQWENMIASMMRLSATFIDSKGVRRAIIDYQGKNNTVGVGDYIAGRKIIEIDASRVYFLENGYKGFIDVSKIPPKPEILDEVKSENQYNW